MFIMDKNKEILNENRIRSWVLSWETRNNMRPCFQETREKVVDEIFQEIVDGYNPIGLKLII
jgi:hypothetical protein